MGNGFQDLFVHYDTDRGEKVVPPMLSASAAVDNVVKTLHYGRGFERVTKTERNIYFKIHRLSRGA
jgi:hypothetical protein